MCSGQQKEIKNSESERSLAQRTSANYFAPPLKNHALKGLFLFLSLNSRVSAVYYIRKNIKKMDYYSDSGSEEEYEQVCTRDGSCGAPALPFDPSCIENVILAISDSFDFRVVLSDERTKGALLVTTGLTIAGGLLGRHYGGKIGAAVGGAIGGACGLGIVAVSMRSIWDEIKAKLSDLFDMVYDYLAGLGIEDYKRAAKFLTQHGSNTQLAMLILETASSILGKKILSSIQAA